MTAHTPLPVPSLLAPGSLPSRCEPIELHTYQGVHLFQGQRREGPRPGYPGLRQFARYAAIPYRLAAHDDPWADWWLIRIEDALERSRVELAQLGDKLEEHLSQCRCRPADSAPQKPTTVTLHFGTPYGYLGAQLLMQFDAYVRNLVYARNTALLDRRELSRWIRRGRTAVIRAYLAATGYRDLGVRRKDLVSLSQAARKAALKMGELPQEVASRALRARHAPTILDSEGVPLRQSTGPLPGSSDRVRSIAGAPLD
jgi:integrating conjugative element protein (TIGR03761 family)